MKELADLLEKKARGVLSQDEERMLQEWAEKDPLYRSMLARIEDEELLLRDLKAYQDIPTKPLQQDTRLWAAIHEPERQKIRRVRYVWSAAAAVALLCCCLYFGLNKSLPDDKQIAMTAADVDAVAQQIQPGKDLAIIKLAHGGEVVLDELAVGDELVKEGLRLRKAEDGTLVCLVEDEKELAAGVAPLANHVIETPLSGQYKLKLPDGTTVWLNAGSKLYFPTQFKGDERRVVLEGEGFFDVQRMPEKPFKIAVRQQLVTVLGTSFNINAYDNEPNIKTTLVEGSLRVTAGNQSQLIKPGQQLMLSDPDKMTIRSVAVEDDIAWKLGYFSFRPDNITVVLRQLERWYNIRIELSESARKELHLVGKIDRKASLDQVIRMFRTSQLVCTLQGRTLTLDM